MIEAREPVLAPNAEPAGAARAWWREPAGLVRFLVIVLATFSGSVGCWIWVVLLLGIGERAAFQADPPHRLVGGLLLHPMAWQMGAWCAVWLALPAVACLWNRRLLPALLFVLAIGFGVATGGVVGVWLGDGLGVLAAALPMTMLAVLLALLVVRFVPSRWWTRPEAPDAPRAGVPRGVNGSGTPARRGAARSHR
ncbi:MAG: hypothetical protein IPJ77_15395 [Planctomycetes bacterium]|nr:hypothetical protein [Planctomycetota bacterium]